MPRLIASKRLFRPTALSHDLNHATDTGKAVLPVSRHDISSATPMLRSLQERALAVRHVQFCGINAYNSTVSGA